MPPPKKYFALAKKLFEMARAGFGVYSYWYHQRKQHYNRQLDQQQRQEQRRKRRRQVEEISSSEEDDDESQQHHHESKRRRLVDTPVTTRAPTSLAAKQTWRQVSLDSWDELMQMRQRQVIDADQQQQQQQLEQDGIMIPRQRFSEGTRVRKHFPGEGWFEGCVHSVRWAGGDNASIMDDPDVPQNVVLPPTPQWIYKLELDNGRWDLVNEAALADIAIPDGNSHDPSLYSFLEFLALWERLGAERIEKTSTVRRANSRVETGDSDTQQNAQYGRILPQATDLVFHILRLKRTDIFLDVGHGIGNFCLQAAYCRGCEARGIEVVRDRFNVSQQFAAKLEQMSLETDGERFRKPGKVLLRHGDLADHANHNWLARANKVVVNNFNGVFAERMVTQTASQWHLDHYIAGLFASMHEGSILVSLSDLQLGPSRREVNRWRQDNNLQPSPNASFFEVVKVELGEAGQVFSWSTSCKAPAVAYLYRRVRQDPNLRTACTLCCNIQCKHSKLGTPIPAVALNREGKAVVGTCECKMTLRSNRRVPHITVAEYLSSREYREWGR
ncbi:lysine N-methyltransferase, H3 lysine-79 specific [Seminavis robusta]|uniref:Histone-lysine N-methyltransferase, H3 lysine-79 specific n=1 Tax=Seminavis robusta TaxID=568900 RepID=A0A9N8DCS7_9STRA|nr:lysine N-methyltransferase, H3 lysine-79 specific [Seminavis robusta]|eukprot:Sro87_g046170.1 lysine N-methyltransferase, H3 lysine-79 specific (557) ;mRNA; r:94083-96101